jgi:glucokinase
MTQRLYAGIDIGATNLKYGLVDSEGTVRYRNLTPTPKQSPAEKVFDEIIRCGEQLLIEADDLDGEVGFIGVGSPGSVNIKTGVIQGTCPNIPNWVGFHLRDRLAERLNLPARVDNDANCAALAEFRFGAGKGYQNIICLTIGTGIGGGLILNGKLHHGADFCAGEIGHMILNHDDESFGAKRMLESVVSAPAILAAMKERLLEKTTPAFESIIGKDLSKLTMRRVFAAVKRGDRLAPEILGEKAKILGRALANLVNVINPELVVLGGGVAEGGSLFVDIVRETLTAEALPVAAESLSVVTAQLGNAAGFIGAAFLGEEFREETE